MTVKQLKQTQDVLCALLRAFQLQRHDSWTRDQLRRHQDRKLEDMVRHAAAHSPFYRQLYRELPLQQEVDLQALPVINKRILMENFDRIVTDRRLRLRELEAHMGQARQDDYFLGKYRVLSTTGTSGLRGVFVYDRSAWQMVLANTIRWHRFAGIRPRLPKRLRICAIGADIPAHVSRCIPESGDVGLFKVLCLSATEPLSELVAALNRFEPQVLMPYPSIAALLANEQLSGRLRIHPEVVATHSEALTGEMRRLISDAWNVSVFDHYGLTEEPHVACECTAHDGLHIFEDLAIVEVLDDEGRPVPSGTLGAKYLLTNLYNKVQPLIRYEVTDIIATTDEPCSCGRPFSRITRIAGRSEELLLLRDATGRTVTVPPVAFSVCLDVIPEIVEFELSHNPTKIDLLVVTRSDVDHRALRSHLIESLTNLIRTLGAEPPAINVVFCEAIQRRGERMGKLQHVRAVW